ncbi:MULTISPECIES: SRPBCC family protein [Bacillaceae]|uniref:SRPBCC family protein n=1 Tax=Bacillaceae TaxID=186817 RepID=UPI001F5F7F48|nr:MULTISPECIES: SRPBCC family protein [Bacillaceae]
MVNVFTKIIINRPVDLVSKYAADPDNAPDWYVNIRSAEWQTEKSLDVGSKVAFKAQFLGRDLAYIYEITELNPGEKLVMKTAQGPFRGRPFIHGTH